MSAILSLWKRAPLAGSLLAGGAAFVVAAILFPPPRDTIELDARTVRTVVNERADALGREVTPEERDEVLRDRVDQEILIREAFDRGLHLTNSTARQRLLGKMRLGLNAEIPTPTFAQLRAFFAANADRYRTGEGIRAGHVFYADRPEDEGRPRTEVPLDSIATGADFRTLGDPFWQGPVFDGITEDRLAAVVGPATAREVFALEEGVWTGPIQSARGTHYFVVFERIPAGVPELELIEEFVRIDWTNERRVEVTDRKLERMRERYDFEVEGRE